MKYRKIGRQNIKGQTGPEDSTDIGKMTFAEFISALEAQEQKKYEASWNLS